MKKNVLSLSIAAAVAGFGMVGAAHAVVAPLGGSTAAAFALQNGGIGQQLIVPYYTAQAENATLINLVNTDRTNGKLVKVRFRGAANSDDVLDFQVLMSPGDVWTANISKGADGIAVLTTSDTSCLRPDKAASGATKFPFSTARLDPTLTGDALAAGTREGYIEILNMADVPPKAAWSYLDPLTTASTGVPVAPALAVAGVPTSAGSTANPLFTAIKHVSGMPPCGAVVSALDSVDPTYDGPGTVVGVGLTATGTMANGMTPPTTGLFANWTIINIVGAAAWSGAATAVSNGGSGNVVYFPQTGTATGDAVATTVSNFTADPLLQSGAFRLDSVGGLAQLTAPAIAVNQNDLPDLSTPYTVTPVPPFIDAPRAQALALTLSLASGSSSGEYLTDPTITASTDWVFSMPSRRYSVALAYSKIGATLAGGLMDTGVRFTNLNASTLANYGDATAVSYTTGTSYAKETATYFPLGYFTKNNASTVLTTASGGRQICVNGISYRYTDREEGSSTTGASLSPVTAGPALLFCGEDSVLSVNLGSTAAPTQALKASVTQKDIDLPAAYVDGWMTLTTPGNVSVAGAATAPTFGLPVLGGVFTKASAGTNSFGLFAPFRR